MSTKADGAKPNYLGDAIMTLFKSCRASLPVKYSQCMPCLDLVRKIFVTDFKMNRVISITHKEHN